MSASDKKKLRKELNAAAMTERQKKEQKEAKKLKAYTVTFVVIMVLVVAIVLGVALRSPVTGLINRSTKAITVGTHNVTTVELNYHYMDTIQAFCNQYSDYGDYASIYLQMYTGFNPAKALNEQVYNQETGETWADYFISEAKSSAQWAYAMYDKAMAEGFTLSESEQKSLDSLEGTLEIYAAYTGYSSVDGYLRSTYGDGANLKTYQEYNRVRTIARAYASKYLDNLEFTDADYREYEKDKYNEYSSYSYASYYLTVSNFLTFLGGGEEVKGEDGKTTVTYTDEQKEAARKAAKEAADSLVIAENDTLQKLNLAISKLPINKDKEDVKATEVAHALFTSISNEDFKEWLSNSARKEGDTTVIEIKSGSGEDEVVSGYYVLMFEGCDENKTPLANVQHILVKFEGGTTDSSTNSTTYTDAEKEATLKKAEAILEEFKKGEKQDSEAFGELAKEKSEDTGSKSNGGLIENIYRDAGYVEAFTDWALEGHKPGDTGIVETEYGYHVMFYKEDGELTYRDYMIDTALTNEKYTEWEEAVVNAVTVTDVNLKGLDRKLVVGS